MDVVKMVSDLWNMVPEGLKLVAAHILSMAGYAAFYAFVVSLTQEWSLSLALTAGLRAFLMVVADSLKTQDKKTEARGRAEKLSKFLA